MANFIVEFPLKTELWQKDILNKILNIARIIYNSLVNISLKRYHEMIKTNKYRDLKNKIRKLSGLQQQAFILGIPIVAQRVKNLTQCP